MAKKRTHPPIEEARRARELAANAFNLVGQALKQNDTESIRLAAQAARLVSDNADSAAVAAFYCLDTSSASEACAIARDTARDASEVWGRILFALGKVL